MRLYETSSNHDLTTRYARGAEVTEKDFSFSLPVRRPRIAPRDVPPAMKKQLASPQTTAGQAGSASFHPPR